ncbi:MAG TPA: DUF1501 domain-containing protein [Planctomycetota bacterium]|nr:DUF1501 domain-containing protein [Planctomycetota bacterium]
MTQKNSCGCGDGYSRRRFLEKAALGMGSIGLALAAGPQFARADEPGGLLAPRKPHFAPKAKRIIHIFPEGGPSHVDTFDPKPMLEQYHNKLVKDVRPDFEKNAPQTATQMGRLSGKFQRSAFKFSKHGQSGIEVSELFPNLAKHVDDMCIIRSMHTNTPVHEPAQLMMTCGDSLFVRPSMGSWTVYGLGTENRNLPAFVALSPSGTTSSGDKHWSNAFLPAWTRGTGISTKNADVQQMIEHVRSSSTSIREQRRQLDLLAAMNREHLAERQNESVLEGRIQAFETAFRMQIEATDAFDIAREPVHIRAMYGDTEQGRQLLLARRLIERGVRFVQVWHTGWDTHDENDEGHRKLCQAADQPLAALLQDLKQRGLLEDTLVLWAGEFGRTPTSDNNDVAKKKGIGRDHNAGGFTVWMAGGGVKRGLAYGATDEFGAIAIEKKVFVHDLHATILHQLGFDHEKLTYRFSGRDFRLTDVHGHVVKDILA